MSSVKAAEAKMKATRTLAVDIGGLSIKAAILSDSGNLLTEPGRQKTPRPATPRAVLKVMTELARGQGEFDRVSVGFPGVVRRGVPETAHNLHPLWEGFNLEAELAQVFARPVRVANDADIQGMGVIAGNGVELVITLGTGLGSALFLDGRLVPNLEVAHHPFHNGKTYEEYLGDAVMKRVGFKRWNKTLRQAITELEKMFRYDCLYIGGGNALNIHGDLPKNVKLVSNVAGLSGGIALWRE